MKKKLSLFSHPFNQESEYVTVLAGIADIFCTVTLTGTNLNTKTQSLTKQKELRPLLLRETFVHGPILDAMAASYMRKQREICNLYEERLKESEIFFYLFEIGS